MPPLSYTNHVVSINITHADHMVNIFVYFQHYSAANATGTEVFIVASVALFTLWDRILILNGTIEVKNAKPG
ncbi:hypothetical protein SAMN05660649_00728 [Desulfotomaculum arcticum]|uniref:Uncharacterized protein n=1 Tax=Desulfotruncus arcticus DSM 17038 TaxID=1121424 RepID=A0A1I2P5V8_9FIRM|nr:hypothetical protein SAMN05660649_00728 [Desulfotomaculum arcticum] [Desulfotruncus arcticus DSM 17038]